MAKTALLELFWSECISLTARCLRDRPKIQTSLNNSLVARVLSGHYFILTYTRNTPRYARCCPHRPHGTGEETRFSLPYTDRGLTTAQAQCSAWGVQSPVRRAQNPARKPRRAPPPRSPPASPAARPSRSRSGTLSAA